MLKIEKTVLPSPEQWELVIEGLRNPKNSWDRMDSEFFNDADPDDAEYFKLGEADHTLMMNLAKGGSVHAKYRRMLPVWFTVDAPLYFWKEFETYRTGVCPNPMDIEMNSCSTMHKIHSKEFALDDFSCEHLLPNIIGVSGRVNVKHGLGMLADVIFILNAYRDEYLKTKDKRYWWQMIQLLPTSYNQKRTVMLNYEVLNNIYHSRKDHKLDEWRTFCDWILTLPYSEIILGY